MQVIPSMCTISLLNDEARHVTAEQNNMALEQPSIGVAGGTSLEAGISSQGVLGCGQLSLLSRQNSLKPSSVANPARVAASTQELSGIFLSLSLFEGRK